MRMRDNNERKGPARQSSPEEDADQAIVLTPYGRGVVIRTRESDGIREVRLLGWGGDGGGDGDLDPTATSEEEDDWSWRSGGDHRNCGDAHRGRRRSSFSVRMMYTPLDHPSPTPTVGDDVVCQYGRGRVVRVSSCVPSCGGRDDEGGGSGEEEEEEEEEEKANNETMTTTKEKKKKYTIALTSWRLDGGRSPATCHVVDPVPRVVRTRSLSEMSAVERVELAARRKSAAHRHFARGGDYDAALRAYAGAVRAVRDVQHDRHSTNETRADLVSIMVTCSNNAATCSAKLGAWDDARRHAQNALILLDSLHERRGGKLHAALGRGGHVDARIFGEWRVKSHLVVARSCMEGGGANTTR